MVPSLLSRSDSQLAQRLEHLTLDDFIVVGGAAGTCALDGMDEHAKVEEQWTRIFSSLRSLMLQCCSGVDGYFRLPRCTVLSCASCACDPCTCCLSPRRPCIPASPHTSHHALPLGRLSRPLLRWRYCPRLFLRLAVASRNGPRHLAAPTKQEYDDAALDADMGSDEEITGAKSSRRSRPIAAQSGPRDSLAASAAATAGSSSDHSSSPTVRRFVLLINADAETRLQICSAGAPWPLPPHCP